MSATLSAFDGAAADLDIDPREEERRLKQQFREAWSELAKVHGWPNGPYSWYPEFLERRVRVLERTLRAVLASDSLTEAERIRIVSVMYGAPGLTRDARLLSDAEARMVQNYRALDATARLAVRTLLDRLAGDSDE